MFVWIVENVYTDESLLLPHGNKYIDVNLGNKWGAGTHLTWNSGMKTTF